MNRHKILVVEDDADGASILEAYLRRDDFLVAIAHDGEHALALYHHWAPDLVLLDILLPRKSGMEVLAEVRQSGDTPVIMVTAMGDEPQKIGALRYGADDYVVKPYSPREVVARVQAVLRRRPPTRAADALLRHGRLCVDPVAREARVNPLGEGVPACLELTPTELCLLSALLRAPYRAFTRAELLQSCAPGSAGVERVVDMHVHNLRRKLEQHGITDVLVTVRAVGYRFK